MKKFITALITLAIVFTLCTFAVSAAYSNDYFSIDVPESYSLEEAEGNCIWTKTDGSSVAVTYYENTAGFDYSDLSEIEMETLDNQIKTTYDGLGLDSVSEVKSENITFNGYGCYNYQIDFSAYGVDYTVLGYVVSTDEIGYTIEVSAPVNSGTQEAEKIISSISLGSGDSKPAEGDDSNTVAVDNIVRSDDGLISFQVPSSFKSSEVENEAMKELWVSSDSPLTGIGYGTADNTDRASLVGLSDKDVEDILDSFLLGAEDSFTDAKAEKCEKFGFEGVKVNGKVTTIGVECFVTTYLFSTEEKLIYIYCYEYEEGADERIEEILSTLTINGTPYEKLDTGIFVTVFVILGALIGGLIGLINGKKRKKQASGSGYAPYKPSANGQQNDFNEANPYADAAMPDADINQQ